MPELEFENDQSPPKRKPYACCTNHDEPIGFDTYQELEEHNITIHGKIRSTGLYPPSIGSGKPMSGK